MPPQVKVVIAGENQSDKVFRDVASSVKGMERNLGTLQDAGKKLLEIFAAKELVGFAKRVLEGQDQIYKLAQKSGVATETLSGLAYAARLADVDTQGLAKGLKTLNQKIAEAQAGNQQAKDGFKDLGISVTDANGKLKPTEEILLAVADRFSRAEDGAAKTALAVKLFGKAGMDLIPFLNTGRDGIEKLVEEARRLGVVISEDQGKAAEQFNDNLKRMESRVSGAANAFLSGLIPSIDTFLEKLNDPRLKDNSLDNKLKALGEWVGKYGGGTIASAGAALNQIPYVAERYFNQPSPNGIVARLAPNVNRQLEAKRAGRRATAQNEIDYYNGYFASEMARLGFSTTPADGTMASHGAAAGGMVASHPYSLHPDKKDNNLKLTDDAAAERQRRMTEAVTKLREAQATREAAIAEQSRKLNLSELDLERTLGLVTLDDYYTRRRDIIAKSFNDEIGALQKKLAEQQALVGKLPANSPDRLKAQAEAEKLQTEISKRTTEREEAEKAATAEEFNARKALRDFLLATEAEIQQAKGNTTAVALDGIRKEFEEKRRALKAEGKDTGAIDEVEQMRIAAVQAEEVARQIDAIYSNLDIAVRRVHSEMAQTNITETDGQRQINELQAKAASQIGGMVTNYQQLAQASGDPRLIQNVAQLQYGFEQLNVKLNWTRTQMIEGLQDSFQGFFTSIMMDAPNAASAIENFGKSVANTFASIIAKMWAMWAVQKLLGWLMPLGGGSAMVPAFDPGLVGGAIPGAPIPGMASGGVLGANSMALVGENGPELFVPSVAGTVIPHDKLGSLAGGTVQNIWNVDARGADAAAVRRLEAMMEAKKNEAVMLSVRVINEQKIRR